MERDPRARAAHAEAVERRAVDPGRPGYRAEALEAFHDGFRAAGIDFVVFLPDSLLDGVEQLILARGEIETFQCSREDEGVAMGIGAWLAGRRPAVLMEGSGVGLSGLILARAVAQRTPVMLVAGHSSALGERFDYHAATRLVAEPVLRALGIPYHVLFEPRQIKTALVEAQRTIDGQKVPVAILVPPFVVREG